MLKVLIVDDEYMVLKGLEAMITAQKDFPVQVEIASDAAEALEKLQDPFHIRGRERRPGLRSIDELTRMYRPARDQTRM